MFFSVGCFAQTDTLRNEYIETYPTKISTQLFILNTSNDFQINYKEEDIRLDLVPNKRTTTGISVQYDIISFSIGFAPKFFDDNKNNKGSRMNSYSFSFFPGKWMLNFNFIDQKGISLVANNGFEQYYPGLKTLKIGGTASYVFNKNFSFRALSFQSERQLKSVGSFAPLLSYYYTQINGNNTEDLKGKTHYIDVALSPSYYYNWIIAKKIVVGGGASLGAGFTNTVDEDVNYTSFLTQAFASISLGYNSDTFYGGIFSKATASNRRAEKTISIDDVMSYGTLFFGYRFDAPDLLTRETEKIKEKIKL